MARIFKTRRAPGMVVATDAQQAADVFFAGRQSRRPKTLAPIRDITDEMLARDADPTMTTPGNLKQVLANASTPSGLLVRLSPVFTYETY